MTFTRRFKPENPLAENALTEALISIGFRFGGKASPDPANIEDALLSASIEGMQKRDFRLLSVFVDWIDVHSDSINLDRLSRIVDSTESFDAKTLWTAIAQWKKKDPRWKRLGSLIPSSPRHDLLSTGTDFLIKKNGEDERFKNTLLRVPNKALRHRLADVLTPEELAARHRSYYYRILIGPSYRADMWAYLETHPKLSPSELAHATYGSFATAWDVKRDFEQIEQAKKRIELQSA